jgi:hypothetical protein
MPTRANPSPASDEQVPALLERNKCPVPFHEVRTRLLGNIASPVMSASPIKVVQDLWGGELPPFDTIEVANELIGALVMGLWNRLTRHQDRASPFRLMRVDTASTREGLAALALLANTKRPGARVRLAPMSVTESAQQALLDRVVVSSDLRVEQDLDLFYAVPIRAALHQIVKLAQLLDVELIVDLAEVTAIDYGGDPPQIVVHEIGSFRYGRSAFRRKSRPHTLEHVKQDGGSE